MQKDRDKLKNTNYLLYTRDLFQAIVNLLISQGEDPEDRWTADLIFKYTKDIARKHQVSEPEATILACATLRNVTCRLDVSKQKRDSLKSLVYPQEKNSAILPEILEESIHSCSEINKIITSKNKTESIERLQQSLRNELKRYSIHRRNGNSDFSLHRRKIVGEMHNLCSIIRMEARTTQKNRKIRIPDALKNDPILKTVFSYPLDNSTVERELLTKYKKIYELLTDITQSTYNGLTKSILPKINTKEITTVESIGKHAKNVANKISGTKITIDLAVCKMLQNIASSASNRNPLQCLRDLQSGCVEIASINLSGQGVDEELKSMKQNAINSFKENALLTMRNRESSQLEGYAVGIEDIILNGNIIYEKNDFDKIADKASELISKRKGGRLEGQIANLIEIMKEYIGPDGIVQMTRNKLGRARYTIYPNQQESGQGTSIENKNAMIRNIQDAALTYDVSMKSIVEKIQNIKKLLKQNSIENTEREETASGIKRMIKEVRANIRTATDSVKTIDSIIFIEKPNSIKMAAIENSLSETKSILQKDKTLERLEKKLDSLEQTTSSLSIPLPMFRISRSSGKKSVIVNPFVKAWILKGIKKDATAAYFNNSFKEIFESAKENIRHHYPDPIKIDLIQQNIVTAIQTGNKDKITDVIRILGQTAQIVEQRLHKNQKIKQTDVIFKKNEKLKKCLKEVEGRIKQSSKECARWTEKEYEDIIGNKTAETIWFTNSIEDVLQDSFIVKEETRKIASKMVSHVAQSMNRSVESLATIWCKMLLGEKMSPKEEQLGKIMNEKLTNHKDGVRLLTSTLNDNCYSKTTTREMQIAFQLYKRANQGANIMSIIGPAVLATGIGAVAIKLLPVVSELQSNASSLATFFSVMSEAMQEEIEESEEDNEESTEINSKSLLFKIATSSAKAINFEAKTGFSSTGLPVVNSFNADEVVMVGYVLGLPKEFTRELFNILKVERKWNEGWNKILLEKGVPESYIKDMQKNMINGIGPLDVGIPSSWRDMFVDNLVTNKYGMKTSWVNFFVKNTELGNTNSNNFWLYNALKENTVTEPIAKQIIDAMLDKTTTDKETLWNWEWNNLLSRAGFTRKMIKSIRVDGVEKGNINWWIKYFTSQGMPSSTAITLQNLTNGTLTSNDKNSLLGGALIEQGVPSEIVTDIMNQASRPKIANDASALLKLFKQTGPLLEGASAIGASIAFSIMQAIASYIISAKTIKNTKTVMQELAEISNKIKDTAISHQMQFLKSEKLESDIKHGPAFSTENVSFYAPLSVVAVEKNSKEGKADIMYKTIEKYAEILKHTKTNSELANKLQKTAGIISFSENKFQEVTRLIPDVFAALATIAQDVSEKRYNSTHGGDIIKILTSVQGIREYQDTSGLRLDSEPILKVIDHNSVKLSDQTDTFKAKISTKDRIKQIFNPTGLGLTITGNYSGNEDLRKIVETRIIHKPDKSVYQIIKLENALGQARRHARSLTNIKDHLETVSRLLQRKQIIEDQQEKFTEFRDIIRVYNQKRLEDVKLMSQEEVELRAEMMQIDNRIISNLELLFMEIGKKFTSSCIALDKSVISLIQKRIVELEKSLTKDAEILSQSIAECNSFGYSVELHDSQSAAKLYEHIGKNLSTPEVDNKQLRNIKRLEVPTVAFKTEIKNSIPQQLIKQVTVPIFDDRNKGPYEIKAPALSLRLRHKDNISQAIMSTTSNTKGTMLSKQYGTRLPPIARQDNRQSFKNRKEYTKKLEGFISTIGSMTI